MSSISLTLEENGLYAEISGEIDHHSAKLLRDELDRACERHVPEVLYIDLTRVSFMDSSGIGLVLGRYRNMEKLGGKTAVVVPEGRVRRILTMAAADRFVKIYDKREDI